MPAAVAAGAPQTTTPWLPTATLGPRGLTGVFVACGEAKGASKKREMDDIEMILLTRGQLRCSARRLRSGALNRLPLTRLVSTRLLEFAYRVASAAEIR